MNKDCKMLVKYYKIKEEDILDVNYNLVVCKNISYRKINNKKCFYNKWYWLDVDEGNCLHGCDELV